MNERGHQNGSDRAADDRAKRLEQAKQRLAEWRAERLGISVERSAVQLEKERQRRQGETDRLREETLLGQAKTEQGVQAISGSRFPTPDCLDPHELEDFLGERLEADRQEHVSGCPFCQVLIGTALPSAERTKQFLDEVRRTCADAELAAEGLSFDWQDDARDNADHVGAHGIQRVARRWWEAPALVMAGAVGALLISFGLGQLPIGLGHALPGSTQMVSAERQFVELSHVLTADTGQASGDVRSATVSPDGQRLAIVKDDGNVTLWDQALQQKIKELPKPVAGTPIVISEGKNWIISSSDGAEAMMLDSRGQVGEKGTLAGLRDQQ